MSAADPELLSPARSSTSGRSPSGRRVRSGCRSRRPCDSATRSTTASCSSTRPRAPARSTTTRPSTPTAARSISTARSCSAATAGGQSNATWMARSHDRRPVAPDGAAVRFNSPNDVVVESDGSIWFTDPPYGILPGTKEGREAPQEYDGCYVFRSSTASRRRWSPSSSTRTASRSRPTSRSSTSPTPAPTATDVRVAERRARGCSRNSSRALPTASGWMSRAASGLRPATTSSCSRPTAPSCSTCRSPSGWQTVLRGSRTAPTFTSRRRPRCTGCAPTTRDAAQH